MDMEFIVFLGELLILFSPAVVILTPVWYMYSKEA